MLDQSCLLKQNLWASQAENLNFLKHPRWFFMKLSYSFLRERIWETLGKHSPAEFGKQLVQNCGLWCFRTNSWGWKYHERQVPSLPCSPLFVTVTTTLHTHKYSLNERIFFMGRSQIKFEVTSEKSRPGDKGIQNEMNISYNYF